MCNSFTYKDPSNIWQEPGIMEEAKQKQEINLFNKVIKCADLKVGSFPGTDFKGWILAHGILSYLSSHSWTDGH